MRQLVEKLKENNDDFEFYPTTSEILTYIKKDIEASQSRWENKYNILDIGCGNGNALKTLESMFDKKTTFKKYGIEKSKTLIDNMDKDIILIGCDFHMNTLIDKEMSIIFCNPPYSEYEAWTTKIINEANAEEVYLVIPERWKENKIILQALKRRCSWSYDDIKDRYNPVSVVGSFDFLDSEYRKARAKVDVVKISLSRREGPFNIWFENEFNIKFNEEEKLQESEEKNKNSLVDGKNLIERLCSLYNNEMIELKNNYKAFESIPAKLLNELGVKKETLIDGLKQKIKGLKNKYWKELFDNLDKVTDRLTTKYRERILSTLTQHTAIDINEENMYSVVIWVIKNSNQYQDDQIVDTYKSMTEPEFINVYKSNIHWTKDTWRYNLRQNATHYMLDYRIVFELGRVLYGGSYHDWQDYTGLNKTGYEYILDIFTIANTLGMDIESEQITKEQWEPSKQKTFYLKNGEIFAQFRAYKNGNLHAKFNQYFIKKLNIEAGKLNGWIKSPDEAAEELGYTMEDVVKYYDSHIKIELKNFKLLTQN